MKKNIWQLLLLALILQACGPKGELQDPNANTRPQAAVESEAAQSSTEKELAAAENEEEEDGLPPFKYPCPCNSRESDFIPIGNGVYEMLYCCKGWDGNIAACSWLWGEFIYNAMPNDMAFTGVVFYLLDSDLPEAPFSGSQHLPDSLRQKVIVKATYSREMGVIGEEYDPFKTGKYKKPKD